MAKYERDDEALVDILSLVGINATVDELKSWNDYEAKAAEKWAAATHLRASDNDVEIPQKPEVLKNYIVWGKDIG